MFVNNIIGKRKLKKKNRKKRRIIATLAQTAYATRALFMKRREEIKIENGVRSVRWDLVRVFLTDIFFLFLFSVLSLSIHWLSGSCHQRQRVNRFLWIPKAISFLCPLCRLGGCDSCAWFGHDLSFEWFLKFQSFYIRSIYWIACQRDFLRIYIRKWDR